MALSIDQNIEVIDKIICRHIDQFEGSNRGEISQDILSQLRNLLEHIMVKIYAGCDDIDANRETIPKAIKHVAKSAKWKDLSRFHIYLQKSVSHYSFDEENSERLMLKYYVLLLKTRALVKQHLSLEILHNINKFPLDTDSTLQDYYNKIASEIKHYSGRAIGRTDKYYIQNIKPFFVENKIYYQVTFSPANDYSSKFDRVMAFTDLEISDFYAVKLSLVDAEINILGKNMPIIIITEWSVEIRGCEFKNFTRIMRGTSFDAGQSEQRRLCDYLTQTGINLVELIGLSDEEFESVRLSVTKHAKITTYFEDLEKCRKIVNENRHGSNLLRYLLYHMNNKIIKLQFNSVSNESLSGLYVNNGCIPFDRIPFNFSPMGHNPKIGDLFSCLDATNREHEILARRIRNNTEIHGKLFTPVNDITEFGDVPSLIEKYNETLWHGHREKSKLVLQYDHVYINQYVDDTKTIIQRLQGLAQKGIRNYSSSVTSWLENPHCGVDCPEKEKALKQFFENSHVALIYGSAGTGKSTIINHIAHFFANKEKLFLAQTNPAVDNMRRRVTASKCNFSTIAKFLKSRSNVTTYDILVIDECSTVSNENMRKILNKASFQLLVLVGDTFQIASIQFGNWFSVARKFVPATSVFELTTPYRSHNASLTELWDRVRTMEDTILELMTSQNYSSLLDDSLFKSDYPDEIVLCLNYGGLYGINNINRFLQGGNQNDAVVWGHQKYKVNDPILFNESNRFEPVIYNNMKGVIVGIELFNNEGSTEWIQFDVELEKVINGMDAYGQDFELLEDTKGANSIIRFSVEKPNSVDEDDEGNSKSVVPFQVSYALSIHKAQGLEYESVKIVITDEVDDLITHNIFYTAITRARKKLKIYWTPEVEKKVLSNIKPRDYRKDVSLLKNFLNH